MPTTTLEERILDLALRGEITDLGLTPNSDGKTFRATFAPASAFGVSIADHVNPVTALHLALDNMKLRKRAPFKDGDGGSPNARIQQEMVEVPAADNTPEEVDPAADLM